MIVPAVVAFLLSTAFLFPFIKFLKAKGVAQPIREEGPITHAAKAQTPTAGGVCFLIAAIISVAGYWIANKEWWPPALIVLLVGFLCGMLGFWDDFCKIRNKANTGVSGKLRLGIEFAIGAALGIIIIFMSNWQPLFMLPSFLFGDNPEALMVATFAAPPLFFVPLAAFVVAATTNAVNLHDGMDGLAAGTSAQIFITMAVIFLATGQYGYAEISAAAGGALLGFLLFNRWPALIFMGDTGSLFIGGLMAALAISGGIVFWFVPLAFIYIAETLSVMLQVPYFKLTKEYTPETPMSQPQLALYKLTHRLPGEGKRLFRMTPLHHHFELELEEKGIEEWKVVAGFWVAQSMVCLVVLAVFFLPR